MLRINNGNDGDNMSDDDDDDDEEAQARRMGFERLRISYGLSQVAGKPLK